MKRAAAGHLLVVQKRHKQDKRDDDTANKPDFARHVLFVIGIACKCKNTRQNHIVGEHSTQCECCHNDHSCCGREPTYKDNHLKKN